MLKEVVEEIVRKKELKDIDRDFVSKIVEKEFGGVDLENKKGKKYKEKFKRVREKLRKAYGVFKEVREKRGERVYDEIFDRIGEVKSVLDIGCGLSSLDFPFDKYKVKYYACDISKKDVEKIRGEVSKAFVFDLVYGNYSKLPKADVCFCFKVLEGLEYFEKGISERVLDKIRGKWIVVSFAKKSLGGKKIKKQGRSWFRKVLKKKGLGYDIFNSDEEIFFIIKIKKS